MSPYTSYLLRRSPLDVLYVNVVVVSGRSLLSWVCSLNILEEHESNDSYPHMKRIVLLIDFEEVVRVIGTVDLSSQRPVPLRVLGQLILHFISSKYSK